MKKRKISRKKHERNKVYELPGKESKKTHKDGQAKENDTWKKWK